MALLTPAQTSLLRRAFVDVCRGYSAALYQDRTVYLRHLSHHQHLDFDDLQARFRDEACAQGAFTEVDRLAHLIAKGLWSQDKENEIAAQREVINRFEEGKRVLTVPSHIRNQDRLIGEEMVKLNQMLTARATQMGVTAETYAANRINDHYVIRNLFKDRGLVEPLFSEVTYDDFNDSDVDEITKAYNLGSEPCSDSNLRLLSVQPFFISYYSLCADNLSDFYGRPVCEMTFYQTRLGGYARHFKNLMENSDMNKVPSDQRNDPEALERTFSSQRNAATVQSEGKVPTNMTKEDIKELGLEGQMTPLPKTNMDFASYLTHMAKQRKP